MTNEQFMTLVRTIMNVVGGVLVSSGTISSSASTTIAGIILPVAAGAWGLFVHSQDQIIQRGEVAKTAKLVGE